MDRPSDSERQERIEAYVSGTLSGEDLRAFEHALSGDEELRTDVGIERVMRETVKCVPVLEFRDLVQRVAEEQTEERSIPVIPIGGKRTWTWLAVAASIALILTVGIGQWMNGPDEQALALDFANQSIPAVRGDDDPEPYSGVAQLDSALAAILTQQPKRAIDFLTAYSTTDAALSCKRDWLHALALLQQGAGQRAIPLLERVITGACHPEPALAKELKGKL